jgi:hypothetical protein
MHTLLREFCMDQSHGRQFARPHKRGRLLTYEEKWMVQHVFETLTKEKNAEPILQFTTGHFYMPFSPALSTYPLTGSS